MEETVENEARIAARHFLSEETEFHLGDLPTERPHPKTRNLSEATARDTAEGVAMLLSVDHDLGPRAREVFATKQFSQLVSAIRDTAFTGGTVAFSGCGATGRLAIILEKMWRSYWNAVAESDPRDSARWRSTGEASYSIMTGGDRALIRSVENFEDFQSFGRRQVKDAGLREGDLLVAISEGGETSSVIGTAWEALERGVRVFFAYNNPTEVLTRTVKRSRELIENDAVTKLDLATGPMALSGSTRLQATTMEMLVVGAAMEIACEQLVSEAGVRTKRAATELGAAVEYALAFDRLVGALETGKCRSGIASFVDFESELYRHGGRVTYLSDEYLLDVVSDTTERTPTFMLPPFRPAGDMTSAVSWAFTKDPVRTSNEAWNAMLGRAPRGIDWVREDYRAMGGLPGMVARPPKLDLEEILSYRIGRERDPSRFEAPDSALLALTVDAVKSEAVQAYLDENRRDFRAAISIRIGGETADATAPAETTPELIVIPVPIPGSPMKLFTHLALKLIFNTVSTATMAKLGRIRGNWMIQVDATNKKLIDRASRIVADLAGLSYEDACLELHRTLARRAEGANEGERYPDSTVVETLRRLGSI